MSNFPFPSGIIPFPGGVGQPEDLTVMVDGENTDAPQINADGSIVIKTPDGGLEINLEPQIMPEESEFEDNLAEQIEENELNCISRDLIEGIDADKRSRAEWISQMERGIDILGLKLENPKVDVGSSAPLEGMSTVRHPLLQQAILYFQANFRGEMLPASGPVKVSTYGDEPEEVDEEAEMLTEDLNYYLTQVATEYYPDTMRMAYQYGLSGHGIKKVYYCPIRRRPVSESVRMQDFIVSNTTTDLRNAERVTQVIQMSKNTMKRMQQLKAYRKVELGQPNPEPPDPITAKVAKIEGTSATVERPEDYLYEVNECYCYLDLKGFEHEDEETGEKTGIALPYRVVIERDSQKVLAIHRDWDEEDEDCLRKDTYVDYVFIYGMGYLGYGLLHLLGNTAIAATAAWRLFIDALMFSNFPGFLYLKKGNRQTNNSFRVAPGSGAPVDGSGAQDIRQTIMPLPYKPPDAVSTAFIAQLVETGERLGGVAQTAVGEGKDEAPVGTTLAMLEQQTKAMSAVHKNAHTSQAKEFQLLRDLFRKYPEALITAGKKNKRRKSKNQWTVLQLLQALENYDIVPVADPNTPTHQHRIAKGVILKQLQSANPQLYDAKKVDTRILHMAQITDPETLFVDPATVQQQPDPKLIIAQAQAQRNQTALQAAAMRAATHADDIESKERIEKMRIAQTEAVHPSSAPLVHSEVGPLQVPPSP